MQYAPENYPAGWRSSVQLHAVAYANREEKFATLQAGRCQKYRA